LIPFEISIPRRHHHRFLSSLAFTEDSYWTGKAMQIFVKT
jgi:hypothetical protein